MPSLSMSENDKANSLNNVLNFASSDLSVKSASVTVSSVSTIISGSGRLTDDDDGDVKVPTGILELRSC